MKKMIERIRDANTWNARASIAANKEPGTPFDSLFDEAKHAKQCAKHGIRRNQEMHLQNLGLKLAGIILRGESQTLHDMARALDTWKRHKAKPNHELVVLFNMAGMFGTGWRKLRTIAKDGKITRGILGKPLAMRDMRATLAERIADYSEEDWQSSRKKIKRYAKEFGIPLDETPGMPKP